MGVSSHMTSVCGRGDFRDCFFSHSVCDPGGLRFRGSVCSAICSISVLVLCAAARWPWHPRHHLLTHQHLISRKGCTSSPTFLSQKPPSRTHAYRGIGNSPLTLSPGETEHWGKGRSPPAEKEDRFG